MSPRGSKSEERGGGFLPYSWVHGAGKWVTAGITSAAALLALIVNAQNLGLGSWLGGHGVGFADYAARRIIVSPRTDSMFAVGDTVLLAATVTDRRGAALVGPTVVWQSSDSAVATVDSSGAVVSRGPGAVRISARVRQVVAWATVVVRPRVTRIAMGGDSTVRLLEGTETRLVAAPMDANGFRVRDRTPVWTSADTTVAVAGVEGAVTARAPGRTVLTASVEGLSARIALEVAMAPGAIAVLSGDGQRASAGRRLPQAVVVQVSSRGGKPVPDATVRFRPEDADAAADPSTATTDRAGRARTTWTLGGRPGRRRLAASVDALDTVAAVFAEADPLPRNTKLSSNQPQAGAAGAAGQPLDQPVVVRATDSLGAALADVPVLWAALDGGAVSAAAERTDSLGEARARWTLGPVAGRQRLRVQVGNPRTMPPLVLSAAARAGPARTLAIVSGDGQHAGAGQPLPAPVVVLVGDSMGNPVAGAQVLTAAEGRGTADSSVVTDERGQARIRWTLGHGAGRQRLTVRLAGGAEVRLTGNAEALAPANIAFVAPPQTAVATRTVPLAAVVTDGYGNPVADAMVAFTGGGLLSPGRVLTDGSGKAVSRWTPPRGADSVSVTAQVRGTSLAASQNIRVLAPRARRR